MLTKEYVTELKNRENGDLGYFVEKHSKDNKSLVFILENRMTRYMNPAQRKST